MNVGYCFTGSFCTFDKSITAMKSLVDKGYNVVPIMSYNAYSIDTRFATAKEFRKRIEQVNQKVLWIMSEKKLEWKRR